MHTYNKTYTGVPIWFEYVSQTEIPIFSEPTQTDNKFIFDNMIYEKIDINTNIEELELTDYPYIGIGKKPISYNKNFATDEQLENIIGG